MEDTLLQSKARETQIIPQQQIKQNEQQQNDQQQNSQPQRQMKQQRKKKSDKPQFHGHHLLLQWLRSQPKENLINKVLLEIGSTRKEDHSEGGNSTYHLAMFCHAAGMHFITVDMDPINIKKAKRVLSKINPTYKAILMTGEVFTESYRGPINFVYLDAFDFYHDYHTPERFEAYQKNLGLKITDENCWQMHLECCLNLMKRQNYLQVICFDDTWFEEGKLMGKGKTAVPILRKNGFSVFVQGGAILTIRPS